MDYAVLLEKMLIFLVLMLIAWVMARKGLLGPGFTRAASRLVVDVFMVGTILYSIISIGAERRVNNLGEILLVTFAVQILGYVVAAVLARLVRMEESREAPFELLMAVGNTMFIALPIVQALYGAYAVLIVSVSCLAFNLLLYSYGVFRLRGREGGGFRVKDMLSAPLLATVAGILVMVTGIPVPRVLMSLFSSLSGATMPLSMMVIGASLGGVNLLEAFRSRHLALVSAVRLLLIPALSFLLCRFLTRDSVLLMTGMIIAASPSAVMISVLAVQYGKDGVFSSEGVLHTTVCSMVTIPLLVALFSRFC